LLEVEVFTVAGSTLSSATTVVPTLVMVKTRSVNEVSTFHWCIPCCSRWEDLISGLVLLLSYKLDQVEYIALALLLLLY